VATRRAGASPPGPPGRRWWWRLVDPPPPRRAERLARLVGLRVVRIPGTRRFVVVAGSADRLRDLLAAPASLVPTDGATIVVAYWRAPRRGWSHGVGPLDHLHRHRVALPRRGRGVATVAVRLSRPATLRDVLRVALPALGPDRPLPAPAAANLTARDTLPGYLPATPDVVVTRGELPARPQIRAHDVVLWADDQPARPTDATGVRGRGAGPAPEAPDAEPPYAVGWGTGRHGPRTAAGQEAVLVDARRINPRGRRAAAHEPDAPRVRLDITAAGGRLGRGGGLVGPLDGAGLTAPALATLRQVGVVDCAPPPDADPVSVAALLVQVAMTGAVLSVPALPERVAALLAPELRDILVRPVTEVDPLAREARSVRQRRAALRGHATAFALPRLAAGTFPELARPPSVSAILVTRRPDRLPAALRAVVGQTYPELEIVLCLHGVEATEPVRALLAGSGRPYHVVRVPAGASLGEALGVATSRARGSLVTKVDDDDSYGAEHVWDLVLARHYSGATVVGKGSEFVHLETLGVTIRRPSGAAESDAEVVAGGTMLLARGDLEAVGGWRPVPRSVDLGLLDRVRRAGGSVYRTHPFGYVYHRHATGHTWDPGQDYFLDSAYARWPGLPPEVLDGGDVGPGEPSAARRGGSGGRPWGRAGPSGPARAAGWRIADPDRRGG
jgi:Glycosyltransferases, probably involved in cell wall biogenesis